MKRWLQRMFLYLNGQVTCTKKLCDENNIVWSSSPPAVMEKQGIWFTDIPSSFTIFINRRVRLELNTNGSVTNSHCGNEYLFIVVISYLAFVDFRVSIIHYGESVIIVYLTFAHVYSCMVKGTVIFM